MKLREDRVRLPTGVVLDEFHVVEYPDWVCVCCVAASGHLVLVEQYRHGVQRSSLELPAGEVNDEEEPETAARRELLEETGYSAPKWHYVGQCAPNPSKQTSYVHLFTAVDAAETSSQKLDQSEDILVRLMAPNDALRLAEEGKITHGIHIMALFWAARKGFI